MRHMELIGLVCDDCQLPCSSLSTWKEREDELKQTKEQISSLRREADEAKEKQATYVTKYEALERNFKQVSPIARGYDRRDMGHPCRWIEHWVRLPSRAG